MPYYQAPSHCRWSLMFDEFRFKAQSCSRMRSRGITIRPLSASRRLELDHEIYMIKFPLPCHIPYSPLEANRSFDGYGALSPCYSPFQKQTEGIITNDFCCFRTMTSRPVLYIFRSREE